MSRWKDGYEQYPWCPCDSKCWSSSADEMDLCTTCQSVQTAMNSMEYALTQEKRSHGKTELQVKELTSILCQADAVFDNPRIEYPNGSPALGAILIVPWPLAAAIRGVAVKASEKRV